MRSCGGGVVASSAFNFVSRVQIPSTGLAIEALAPALMQVFAPLGGVTQTSVGVTTPARRMRGFERPRARLVPPVFKVNEPEQTLEASSQVAEAARSSRGGTTFTQREPVCPPTAAFASGEVRVNFVVLVTVTVRVPLAGTVPSAQSGGDGSALSEAAPSTSQTSTTGLP